MLTDQQAHDLLHLAAGTVDVDPAGPVLASSRRRTWPVVTAVASVVLVVGGVAALTRPDHDNPDPSPPTVTNDDGQFRLGPDQVPSVFGYSRDAAVAMLEARGLQPYVAVVSPNECDETTDRITGIDPRPGALIPSDRRVTVFMAGASGGANAYCASTSYHRDDAWALVDYANGRGEKPPTVGGLDLGTVTERLREWSTEVGRYETVRRGQGHLRWPTPQLTTDRATAYECARFSNQVAYADVLAMSIRVPIAQIDGVVSAGLCRTVLVAFDEHDRILDVAVGDDLLPRQGRQVPADVVGNTVAYATERLEAQGLNVEPVGRVDCQPESFVTAQQPVPGQDARAGTTVRIAYTTERGPCVEDGLEIRTPAADAAEALLDFARGRDDLPPVADEIDLYVASEFQKHLSGQDAAEPENWRSGCGAGDTTINCLLNMLDIFDTDDVVVTEPFLREDSPCYVVHGELPDELTTPDALSRSASFGDPEPATCADNWEAQVWLDEERRIFAVNLLQGNPAATD